jgi:hypothetical protein
MMQSQVSLAQPSSWPNLLPGKSLHNFMQNHAPFALQVYIESALEDQKD